MKLKTFEKRCQIPAPVEKVFAWHGRPGAIERLSPPWAPVHLIKRSGGLEPGTKVDLEVSAFGPFSYRWHARHTEFAENRMFKDIQESGPFSKWVHTHRFAPDGPDACFLEDHIDFRLPLHPVSSLLLDGMVKDRLARVFAYRHNTTISDINDHSRYRLSPMTILVSGSSGLIAKSLIPFLTTGGHRVIRLVRRPPRPGADAIFWDPAAGNINISDLDTIDAVIHLAGENIGEGSWNDEKKKRIIESRTRGTALLASTLAHLKNPPRVFLSASAIGYYGNRGDQILTEADGPGDDFISEVCTAWETAAQPAVEAGIRTAMLRIGIVLTPLGGALKRLLPVFQFGFGGRIGSGTQHVSWIGIDDVLGAILHVLADSSIEGPVNLVAPNPVSNAELTKSLGRTLSRPTLFALPESAVKLAFGQMGTETVLASTRVQPTRLEQSGYRFRHPELAGALEHLLGLLK